MASNYNASLKAPIVMLRAAVTVLSAGARLTRTSPAATCSRIGGYFMWPVVGHEPALSRLKRSLEKGALGHAYLISGPPRVGKMTLALTLAQALNCRSAEPLAASARSASASLGFPILMSRWWRLVRRLLMTMRVHVPRLASSRCVTTSSTGPICPLSRAATAFSLSATPNCCHRKRPIACSKRWRSHSRRCFSCY